VQKGAKTELRAAALKIVWREWSPGKWKKKRERKGGRGRKGEGAAGQPGDGGRSRAHGLRGGIGLLLGKGRKGCKEKRENGNETIAGTAIPQLVAAGDRVPAESLGGFGEKGKKEVRGCEGAGTG